LLDGSMTNFDAPSDSPSFVKPDTSMGGGQDAQEEDGSGLPPNKTLMSLAVTPAMNTLNALNGAISYEQLKATATFTDGTMGDFTSQVDWSTAVPAIGSVNASGEFATTGTQGGLETVTASFGTIQATATIVVSLQFIENPGFVSTPVQMALQGTTTPDPNVKWAYPYNETLFPRGLNESTLMWIGPTAVTDDYYVHLHASTYDLQSFTTAPNQWFDFTTTDWQAFLNSTTGTAQLTVARWNGTTATTLCNLTWTIASGSMRGTIYYAAYQVIGGAQTGQLVRIDPGATAYTNFLGTSFTCPACHTVSAKGNELLMNAQTGPLETSYGYDLLTSTPTFSGYATDGGASQWALTAVTPDGTTVVEDFAPLYGNIPAQVGAFNTATGAALTNTGLTKPLWMPTFAPDGALLVYVDPTTHDLRAYDWDPVGEVATNDRLLVTSASNATYPQIQYPTVSPDHQWVVYQRGTALGSLGVPGDLYTVSVANPGTETALAALNGTGYPFAAGARDLNLNYEPTFAPVAAGGYFWLVFHSRRTYGNKLTQPAFVASGTGVKQLWVAGFEQAPTAGMDPSHAPFYLGGQSPITLNTRGYFALPPCKQDGQMCVTGTDCCGGFCNTADGGASVCGPMPSGGCAEDGDKCTKTADCCNAATGATCINGVCSEPPPPVEAGAPGDAGADADGGPINN
jgi:hypothetical protein